MDIKIRNKFVEIKNSISDWFVIQCYINPYLTNGFSHRYHLGESTFILGVLRGIYFIFLICR